jgi:hypothetical protein
MLEAVFSVEHGYGILKVFYSDFVDGYVAIITLILNIFHLNKYRTTKK